MNADDFSFERKYSETDKKTIMDNINNFFDAMGPIETRGSACHKFLQAFTGKSKNTVVNWFRTDDRLDYRVKIPQETLTDFADYFGVDRYELLKPDTKWWEDNHEKYFQLADDMIYKKSGKHVLNTETPRGRYRFALGYLGKDWKDVGEVLGLDAHAARETFKYPSNTDVKMAKYAAAIGCEYNPETERFTCPDGKIF